MMASNNTSAKMATVFCIAVVMVLGYINASAQTPVDTTTLEQLPRKPDPTLPNASQPVLNESPSEGTQPLIRIRTDAIPPGLRKTLGSEDYRGWEQSEVYQDPKTFEYRIDIRSGDSLKTFRFDRTGNPAQVNPTVQEP